MDKRLSNVLLATSVALIVIQANVFSDNPKSREQANEQYDPRQEFLSDIPEYPGNVILGRPTDHSVTASIMMNSACEVVVEYGSGTEKKSRSDILKLNAGEPKEILIDGLKTDTAYSYRITETIQGATILPRTVSYVRSALPAMVQSGIKNGLSAYSYKLCPVPRGKR